MTTYTYSEARQKFSEVLNKALTAGKVLIKRRDGSAYILQPISNSGSPLNVKGIEAKIRASEIIDILKKVRHR